jgi:glycosyltransferase involved in cell wall biosynthesis
LTTPSSRVRARGARAPAAPTNNARPTVVRIIARLNVGGPALHVTHLTAGLRDRYPTLLVAGRVDEGEAEYRGGGGERAVPVEDVAELGRAIRPWDDLVALVKLVRLLRRARPAIVHTHTAKAGVLGRIAALLVGVPIRVHTFHGHVFHGYFGPVATRVFLAVERLLARRTTCILTVSESQAEELAGKYRICARERIRVMPLGLDLDRFQHGDRDRLRAELRSEIGAGDGPVVSIVGRLVPIKNHDLFLDGAARLLRRGVAATFVIVGGGPEEARLRERAHAEGLGDRVRFLGWRADLERIYAGSDVVALTSRNEGTPVCLIEALAAGCAVAATDVGGVRDVLEDGRAGLLVPPGDADGLAFALERLLTDPPLRRSLAQRGPGSARRRYAVQRLLDDMAALYTELGAVAAPHSHSLQPQVRS